MAMLKIKKGDTVRVIAGKDKDKEGKVLAVDARKMRVVVEGVNMITKHEKPSMANVMYLHKGQPTRVGFRFENDKKVRFAKKTGETIG